MHRMCHSLVMVGIFGIFDIFDIFQQLTSDSPVGIFISIYMSTLLCVGGDISLYKACAIKDLCVCGMGITV